MRKISFKKVVGVLLAGGMVFSALTANGFSVSKATAEAKVGGKVAVTPYIQYTFDSADTMLQNSGASAADTTKNYTLNLLGNATPTNMCYMGDVEFKDNSALYLDGENNPFANGDLTDFSIALDVSARYSSWYASVVSWDGVTGDADNANTNGGNYSGHKYMRVSSAWKASDANWLRFIDNTTWNDEYGNSILNKPHWESWGRGTPLYTGERTVTETPNITLIISVDRDSKMIVKSYMGIYEQETIEMDLSASWDLFQGMDVQRFTLGGAYDSRGSHLEQKLNGRMDNVRIYDFAMSEAEMDDYAISEDKQVYVDGVEIDSEIVGGSVTADKICPQIGEEVTLTPVADANAEFIELTVNGEKLEAADGVYKATMLEGGLFVSAKFIRSFSVAMDSAMENGTVVAENAMVKEGETVTLTVTPNSGYQVKSVYMNGATVEAVDGVYSFVMPSENVTISAEFAKWLNVSVKEGIENGTVSVNKTECWENDSVIITAKPAEGYEIKKVLVNGKEVVKSGIVYKFTATEDSVVEVKFGKIGGEGGCGSSLTAGGATSLLAFGAAVVVLLKKKRK